MRTLSLNFIIEARLRVPFLLRCMAHRRNGRYIAECIDLNIMAMADNPEDALTSLKSAIMGHLKVAMAGATPSEMQSGCIKGLVPRPSPWKRRFMYHALCLLAAFQSANRGFRLCDLDVSGCSA